MLTEKELRLSIVKTEGAIKYYRQTTIQSVLNLRAMRRDLANYKQHLKTFYGQQLNLPEGK